MSLYIQGMSTCALQEIASLQTHATAKEAMQQFCRQTLGSKGDCKPNGGYSAYSYSTGINGNKGSYSEGLGENYVFHGVEKSNYDKSDKGDPKYAAKFAAFILKEKLGACYGGDAVANHRYHPDHFTRVFVWNPDREAVKAWWLLNNPAAVAATVIVVEAKPVVKPAVKKQAASKVEEKI